MSPVPVLDPLITFSRVEFAWLFYFTIGWVVVWGGHALLWRSSASYRASPWPWYRLVGLVLLLFPFIRILNGIWESISFVATPGTQAPTPTAEAWWTLIRRNMMRNFLVPLVGLYLASGHVGRFGDSMRQWGRGMRAALASVGMWPRVSWTRDAAVGSAAFLVIFFSYVALANLLAPFRGQDTGEASRVFDAITPLLAVSLALMAGITEEFLYRGVLLVRVRGLLPRVPVWMLLIGSSLFFGLAHAGYGTIANMVFPFLLGLAVGALALLWGVWPAVIVHAMVNFMIFLGTLARLGHDWAGPAAGGVLLVAAALPLVYFGVWAYREWNARQRGPDDGGS